MSAPRNLRERVDRILARLVGGSFTGTPLTPTPRQSRLLEKYRRRHSGGINTHQGSIAATAASPLNADGSVRYYD